MLRSLFISMALSMVGCGRASSPPAPAPPAPPADGRWLAASLEHFDAERTVRLRGGRPVMITALWATWCEPCIAEMPELDAFQKAHPDALVLGLATDPPSAATAIQAVLDRVRPSYPQAFLDGGEGPFLTHLGLAWDGILPKTIALAGDVRLSLPSPVTRASLEAALAPYLAR